MGGATSVRERAGFTVMSDVTILENKSLPFVPLDYIEQAVLKGSHNIENYFTDYKYINPDHCPGTPH